VRQTVVLSAANYPDLRIGEAVRASMTLPIFIRPFLAPNGHIWVDGGVRANFPWFCVPEAARGQALGLCFARHEFSAPRNLSEYILSMIHFDESKKTAVPYASNNIITAATPPFPAWFLRLRAEDYTLVVSLARAAYEDWVARRAAVTAMAESLTVVRLGGSVGCGAAGGRPAGIELSERPAGSGRPQESCGSPLLSAPPNTPASSSPAHHTVEPLDIPLASLTPSRGSSPHSPPRKSPISRRWSF
jgi:hypothetical protein